MRLSDLYEYVFGDRAVRREETFEKLTDAAKQNKERERIGRIKNDFDFLKSNDNLNKNFLTLLSSLGTSAEALKNILYSSAGLELSPGQISLIRSQYDDDYIKAKFHQLNRQFKYFTSEEEHQSEQDFIKFYKACKLTGDFLECNNDEENTLAADLAYKMLVVCGAAQEKKQSLFANVNAYLKLYGKGDKPVHDSFVQTLPVNDPALKDLAGWRKFIKKYGAKALEYFQEAQAMEDKLKRAPQTKEEAETIASQLTYTRASEYPELASVCMRYHVSEHIFNKCLEIDKKRKKSDQLPDVAIDGSVLNEQYAGYHFVKLPINDPRAYILGKITNCCQSIGDHGERCVIDGVTREKNGFYVLVKQKRKADASPLVNGNINYKEFEIVGQGYAWLSRHGNLTLDSWENLRPEADDQIAVPLLKEFSRQVTEKPNDIVRVTIGIGGKTPEALQKQGIVPEKIAEGRQYGDSFGQSEIYFNKKKLNEKINAKIEKDDLIENQFWQTKMECVDFIKSLNLTSINQLTYFAAVFLNTRLKYLWNNAHYVEFVKSIFQCRAKPLEVLEVLYLLNEKNELNDESMTTMKDACSSRGRVEFFFAHVTSLPLELISGKNIKLLADHAAQSKDIARALSILYEANPALVNDENKRLLDHAAHMDNISDIVGALSRLYEANPALVNDENLKLLINHAAHAEDIARALSTLYRANPALVNEENKKLLSDHAAHANRIAYALSTLYQANSALMNDENLKLLINHVKYVGNIDDAIYILCEANPVLVNDDNLRLLSDHAAHAEDIARALSTLYQANPALVNNENKKLLSDHAAQSKDIARALSTLYRANPALVNEENKKLLSDHAAHANSIACALYTLYRANSALMNDENLKLLINHVEYVGNIDNVIYILYHTNPVLVNDDNLRLLSDHAAHAEDIARALYILYQANPALVNENTFKLLLDSEVNKIGIGELLAKLYQECLSLSSRNSSGLFAPPAIPPKVDKLKDFLCGDVSVHFNQEEKEALRGWNVAPDLKNIIVYFFEKVMVENALPNDSQSSLSTNEARRPK